MSAWAVKDKTESWDTVCDRAWAGEPQFVTRGPSQTVVVISYVDYHPVASKRRKVVKNPKLAFKISEADLFADGEIPMLNRMKIGSMKDEIRLPDNFDQEFEGLDDLVASMFTGVAS